MISRKSARLLGEAYTVFFSTEEVRRRGVSADVCDFLYEENYPDWLLFFLNVQSNPTNERLLKRRIMGFHTGEAFTFFKNPYTDTSPEERRTAGQLFLRALAQSILQLTEKFEQTKQTSQLLNELKSQLELDGYVYRNGRLYDLATSDMESMSERPINLSIQVEDSVNLADASNPSKTVPEIEIRETPNDDPYDDDLFDEYQFLVRGSVVEGVKVSEDLTNRTYFSMYSEREEVGATLLQFTCDQFFDIRVIDIDAAYTVDWNRAIGQVSIQYDPELKTSYLSIQFNRVASWHGWPFSFDEYYRTLNNRIELSQIPNIDSELSELPVIPCVKFLVDNSLPLATELERCLIALRHIHEEVIEELKAQTNSLEISFDFPEAVRVPCEQYLLYFGQFLADVGVKATTNIRHEAGQVLFAITPQDKDTALDKIHAALGEYLNLARAPVNEASIVSIAEQRLAANVDHLKGQLRLKTAELQLAHATIQTQQVAIDVLKVDVLLESVKDVTPRTDDKESFLGGMVALKAFNYRGVEVNYPEIFRKVRKLFRKDRD